ncbi:MAG: alpha-ketoacid dehydrogenase subunit beta [Candidatus Omnitrophica bacterium]|nr:alpha-ketoacid dehydrogenase subunit beta [Candidatus Omnitrophota bacterium]
MDRRISYAQAISEALVQGMEHDPNVFIFGLGVDDYKGIFGTTREAFLKFGGTRVFDTPASENALTGIAIGAALNKKRPVLVHARNDFMFLALDQMINNAAKWKYTYAGKSTVPIVVRGIIGKGWGQGPTHSQSLQSVLAHFPGLIVAMPANACDVKGIILQSLKSDAPVVILEHRSLYDLQCHVPPERFTVPFGRARIARAGTDVTVAAVSWMAVQALKAADELSKVGISVEVIDPVTVQPLDEQTIVRSVRKTGRLIAADTSWLRCSFASEVAAIAAEKAFDYLKSPVKRIAWPECPCPVSKALEEEFYPTHEDIVRAVYELMDRKDKHVFTEKVTDTFVGPY